MAELKLEKFEAVSDKARERVYELVLSHYKKHPNSPWSGKYLVELERSIKAFYNSLAEEYSTAFRDTLPDIMKEFYDRAVKEIKTAGKYKAILGTPDAKRINYFLDSTYEQVAMKTQKMRFEHIKALRNLSADVLREASLTGSTYKDVSKSMLARAMNIKDFEFIDNAGKKWASKSYFNMLARTELMNAARASYDDKMADEGFDVMRLSTSGKCCDKCAKFEGKLFSLTGATPGLPTKQDLIDAGVFHPNCTHSYSMVPDYIVEEESNGELKPRPYENKKPSAKSPETANKGIPKTEVTQEYKTRKANWERENKKAVIDGLQREEFVAFVDERARIYADDLMLAGKDRETLVENYKKKIMEKQNEKFIAIADKLSAEYLPGMEKYGDLPKLIFDPTAKGSHVTRDGNELHILTVGKQIDRQWNQLDGTIKHEFEHWLQIRAMQKDETLVDRIRDAGTADWEIIKGRYKGHLEILKGDNSLNMISNLLYDVGIDKLPLEQRHVVIGFTDSFASLAGGEGYGYGHTNPGYYKNQNKRLLYGEAIANIKALQSSVSDGILQLVFPKLNKLVKELQK